MIWQVSPSSVFHNGTDIVFTVSRRHQRTTLIFGFTGGFNMSKFLHLKYHGIVQMQVEDDTSPSQKGRRANIHVVGSRVGGPASAFHRKTLSPGSTKGGASIEVTPCSPLRVASCAQTSMLNCVWTLKEPQEAAESSTPKPCTPDLMGLLRSNQSTNQLFHCNGVSWEPWTPTHQVSRTTGQTGRIRTQPRSLYTQTTPLT